MSPRDRWRGALTWALVAAITFALDWIAYHVHMEFPPALDPRVGGRVLVACVASALLASRGNAISGFAAATLGAWTSVLLEALSYFAPRSGAPVSTIPALVVDWIVIALVLSAGGAAIGASGGSMLLRRR